MYKIAILGAENSHADAFITLVQSGKYPDIEIVGVYTDDEKAKAHLSESYGVYNALSYDEFVGKVDGVMVTARHGDNHLKYVKPYLPSGIPVFIDKPATASVEDALELVRLLKKHGNKFSGGSSCIHTPEVVSLANYAANSDNGKILGGFVRAPISLVNDYGNEWFYSQHLVEIMQRIFGYYPTSVRCYKRDGQLNAVYRYADYDVFTTFVDGNYTYYAAVSTEKGVEQSFVEVTSDIFKYEFDEYCSILRGGPSPKSLSELIAPVYAIDALLRSAETGEEIAIGPVPTSEDIA